LMLYLESARRQRIAKRQHKARRSIKSLKVRRCESNVEHIAHRDDKSSRPIRRGTSETREIGGADRDTVAARDLKHTFQCAENQGTIECQPLCSAIDGTLNQGDDDIGDVSAKLEWGRKGRALMRATEEFIGFLILNERLYLILRMIQSLVDSVGLTLRVW
jgi:hypothetical protein